jgi:hypothetical protein
MDSIKCRIVFVNKVRDNTTCNRDTHSKNIDEDKELVLHHIAEGDQQEIFEHTESSYGTDLRL